MNLQNYQLIKENNWYYLAKKRLAFSGYVNAAGSLDDYSQWKGQTPSSSKVCSPVSKSELSDQPESKPSKNLSPLVLNAKEKGFDIATESVGRSSPLTIKSDSQSPSEPRRHSRESSCVFQEKRLSAEGINLEGISMLHRARGRDLVLRMKGSHESISSGERRRSNETSEDLSNARDALIQNIKEGDTYKDKEKEGQRETTDKGDTSLPTRTESFDSPSSTFDNISFSPSAAGSHTTSAVQSPVVSDVSIQLTKIDGQCEPFKSSPERNMQGKDLATDSYDSEDQNEAVLKRCSSFAGFKSEESCTTITDEESYVSHEVSPEKGHLQTLGSLGRLRHCSAPLSGQATPKNRVSVLPYTPSCISSRGSFTEDGKNLTCSNFFKENNNFRNFGNNFRPF